MLVRSNLNLLKKPYVLTMKIGQFVHILAILLMIIVFVQPVRAAENETNDAATAFYNAGVNLLETKEYERGFWLGYILRQPGSLYFRYQ